MLVITKLNDDCCKITFGYCKEYFNRVRALPNSQYDPDERCFYIPMSSYIDFAFEFKGEAIYKPSKYDFTGSSVDDYTELYKIDKKYDLPPVNVKPYYYQEYGFQFMINKLFSLGFVLNCDSVGLGKTFMAILTAMKLVECNEAKKILILCKKSLRSQWKEEISKFTSYNTDNVLIVNGTSKKKEEIYNEFDKLDEGILISNYDVVVTDKDFNYLKKMHYDLLIIDEVHILKNPKAKKSKRIFEATKKTKYKVLLTGTPMASKPDDLFGVIRLACNKYFGAEKDFEKNFIKKEYNEKFYKNEVVGYMNLDVLESMTHNIMISRSEKEVELDLPEILPAKVIKCELDSVQEEILELIDTEKRRLGAQKQQLQEKKKLYDRDINKSNELKEQITKLSDISQGLTIFEQVAADDPRLFLLSDSENVVEKYGSFVTKSYKLSNKNQAVLDIVEEVVDAGQKIIIFTMFERAVRLLEKDIKDKLNLKVVTYTGGVDAAQREINIKAFKENDDVNVIILTSAGEEGLNLQVANHVIHYDQPYKISNKIQREGRARRVGSKHSKVYIYDLVSKDTVDEKRLESLEQQLLAKNNIVDNNSNRSKAIIDAMKNV